MNVVLELETTEVVAVHYDELLAATAMLGHDVVAVSCLTMCLVGHLDCLTESEACFEFGEDVHVF